MKRGISSDTRHELIGALSERYRQGSRSEKGKILDELVKFECVNSHWPHLIAIGGPTPGLLPPPWGREKARRFPPGPVIRIPGFGHLLN